MALKGKSRRGGDTAKLGKAVMDCLRRIHSQDSGDNVHFESFDINSSDGSGHVIIFADTRIKMVIEEMFTANNEIKRGVN